MLSKFLSTGVNMSDTASFMNLSSSRVVLADDARSLHKSLLALEKHVEAHTLSNGLKVILYKRGKAPVFAGLISVRLGGIDEPVGKTGVSHLLEHMAFKGTSVIGTSDFEKERILLGQEDKLRAIKNRSPEQENELNSILSTLEKMTNAEALTEELTRRGASDLNATTSKELTSYFVNLPKTAFEFWAWLESERLINPVFRQFYQERDVVLEERRMRYEDDPTGKLYENLLMTAFVDHPYRDPVIGYEKDLLALTRKDLSDYHSQYYIPSNLVVSVVGDVDPQRDLEVLEKYFGRIAGDKIRPSLSTRQETPQTAERQVVVSHPSSPQLFIGYKKPAYPHSDDAPLSVLQQILAGSFVSPLYVELVKNRQVATSISVFEAPGSSAPNLFVFSASPRHPHSVDEVVESVDDVIKKFIDSGPTEEQLAIAQRSMAVNYLGELKSNMALARQFASSHLLFGDWKASIKWFGEVLDVTVSDVHRVARQYLVSHGRTIARIKTVQVETTNNSKK
jgi:predicted Zn-dependent peptidase